MPSSASLCREIERAIDDRPFRLEFWDGNAVPATTDGGPTFTFRSPDAIAQVLRAPGELGLGRAYVLGDVEVDDLDGLLGLLGRWSAGPLSAATKARLGAAAVRAAGVRRPPPPPAAELQPRNERHSKRWDSESVRHHYDVSNEFFALFLDESMTYSCALFDRPEMTLEEAQRAKLDLICRKLGLGPGKRVLDIGSGWGSFGIHAAREHGATVHGITLSPPQAELAEERARAAGVGDLVSFEVRDYRDMRGESFDAVCSIGMIEHVGDARLDEYAQVIADVLAPDGLVLNHGITWSDPEVHIGADFSERYVFPGGEIPPLSRVVAAFERAGLETHHVENLHEHYSETLRHWATRLDRNLEEARRLAGDERVRVWRLYLRAARNGFESGQTQIHQTLLGPVLTEETGTAPRGAPERSVQIRSRLVGGGAASRRRRGSRLRIRRGRSAHRP